MVGERFKYDGALRELSQATRAVLDAQDANSGVLPIASGDLRERRELDAVKVALERMRSVFMVLSNRRDELNADLTMRVEVGAP